MLDLFGGQLEVEARQELATFNGRRKSIHLHSDWVDFRRLKAKLVIVDPAAVLRWAKVNLPETIIMMECVSKTAINAHAAEPFIGSEGIPYIATTRHASTTQRTPVQGYRSTSIAYHVVAG